MYKVVVLLVGLALPKAIFAQNFNRVWTRTYDGGGIDSAADIALGSAGDPYVIGTALAPDSSSTLLVHYSTTGNFIFAKKIGHQQMYKPHLTTDGSGNAVIQAFHNSGNPAGGFVMKIAPGGSTTWLRDLGFSAYPLGVQCVGNRIYVVDNLDATPWAPEWWILTSDGQVTCTNLFHRSFYGWNMKVPSTGDPVIVGSLDSPGAEAAIAARAFNESCDRSWSMAFGLGSRAWGSVITFDNSMRIAGNIEIQGSQDVWVGEYEINSPYEARFFSVVDWGGGNDEVSSGAGSPNGSVVIGHAEATTQDVLIGRLANEGDSWWTYDGPAHGTDDGIDVDFLPNGQIVALARLGLPAGGVQQGLLLYDSQGQLLDVEIEPSISPVAIAITAAGEVYTTGLSGGNIVIEKYTITPATGIPSPPSSSSNGMALTIGPVPAHGPVAIRLELGSIQGAFEIAVFDVMGRRVRNLAAGNLDSSTRDFMWDGKNRDGESVSAGVYFIQVDVGQRRFRGRAVIAR